jgi:hypothetical protein
MTTNTVQAKLVVNSLQSASLAKRLFLAEQARRGTVVSLDQLGHALTRR